MHVVLGMLGTIVTILILLNRLAEAGIDLGGLNPFLWHRRRQWKKKLQGNPVYKIESPLDMTALLATATAKVDGDMSSDEKKALLDMFQSEFGMNKKEAAELLIASAYLLGSGEEVRNDLEKVMQPSVAHFTEEQAASASKLLGAVSAIDEADGELKREFVARIESVFQRQIKPAGKWD